MHTDHIIGRRGTEPLSESGPTSPGTVASHANVARSSVATATLPA